MISFSQFLQRETLSETPQSNTVKIAAFALAGRLASLRNRVKQAVGQADQVAALADLIVLVGYVGLLNLAAEQNDVQLLRSLKSRTGK